MRDAPRMMDLLGLTNDRVINMGYPRRWVNNVLRTKGATLTPDIQRQAKRTFYAKTGNPEQYLY
jgi:hypothetical protein